MKKVLFLAVFTLFSVSLAQSRTPPAAVAAAFHQKFPNVGDVDWGREKRGEWEAEFDLNGRAMSANFSADGTWIETETEIKVADLPAPVRAKLTGKKVKEVARIDRADGTTVFEAEIGKKDLIFDAAGKQIM